MVYYNKTYYNSYYNYITRITIFKLKIMKAIETFYNGVTYRSRLEAKWAIYFDHLGIKYHYEPEGFTNGVDKYLPDFYLPDVYYRGEDRKGVYLEIKPESYVDYEVKCESWFTEPLFLILGPPIDTHPDGVEWMYESWSERWDNCMGFYKCIECGRVKIEFAEGGYMHCSKCNGRIDMKKIQEAEIAAKNIRFWI